MNATNRRSKSSPEGLEVELRDLTSAQKGDDGDTKSPVDSLFPAQRKKINGPPVTFHDILAPQLITTSTLSEAGYMGYRKSRSIFKSTRSSTFPLQTQTQTTTHSIIHTHAIDQPPTIVKQRNYPSPRRSTLKKMKGVMHSIRRSISSLNDSKKKTRPPIPSSSAFAASNSQSRFGTGPGRHSLRRQDGGYLNLSDGEDVVGEL